MSSLANALRLLSNFGPQEPELRVSEVARRLGLPKSSVSRLLNELTEANFVERDRDRRFRPGPELFRLGSLYSARVPMEDRVDEFCRQLVQQYPATAYVGVLRGADLIVLRRHEGPYPVRFIQDPGSSIPAYATAVGKALLARLPREELEAILPETLVCEPRDVTMTRDAMIAELDEARKLGYARLDNSVLGVGAIGVAVGLSPGRDLGFAICYARETVAAAEQIEIAGALRNAAESIGRLCHDPFWSASG